MWWHSEERRRGENRRDDRIVRGNSNRNGKELERN